MARTWTQQEIWQRLSPTQKAAAMALLEADTRNGRVDVESARNALGAMINRAQKTGEDLGQHVSQPIYQPTIEMAQFARLPRVLQAPEFQELTTLADKRSKGEVGDWVQGATHFLAPEKTMLALHRQDPDKYHNWGPLPNSRGVPGKNWTGFDPATGEYKGVVMRDASHAFLAPEGRHEAGGGVPAPQFTAVASAAPAAAPSLGTAAAPELDKTTALAGLGAYWQAALEDEQKSKSQLEQWGNEANAAIPSAPKGAQFIQGARRPQVDLRSLLAVLKERGVDPDNPGGLGSRGGGLGTRRT